MKNTFFVVAVLALGIMLISFALDDPTGQQFRTVTRGQAAQQPSGQMECQQMQVNLIAAMVQVEKLAAKYEDNAKTVKKVISQWQIHTSAIINLTNNTLYPWSEYPDNISAWIDLTTKLQVELEYARQDKIKVSAELTRALIALYELQANVINCHLRVLCPPACTLQERRTRTAALECDIEIRQLKERITTLEANVMKIQAEWTKIEEITLTVTKTSKAMVALINKTGKNKWDFAGFAAFFVSIKTQTLKITSIEKRIAELVVFTGQVKSRVNEIIEAAIRCVRRKCPSCTATVGDAYTTPRDHVVTSTPREPAVTAGGEAIGGTQLNCEQECANRGMTTQPRDWTSTIESQLNANICKKSVRISFGQIVRLSQNNQVACTCYPTSPPQLQFGPTAVCPKNNPCNQEVPCNGQIECDVGNTHWTVKCSFRWKRVMADVQKMMYQYAPQLASG